MDYVVFVPMPEEFVTGNIFTTVAYYLRNKFIKISLGREKLLLEGLKMQKTARACKTTEDLVINPKDFPGIKIGDIVEIYHPEDEFSRLLLQVTAFKEDFQTRESISIEQSIASAFQLRTYYDVHINVVDPTEVALDSVELTFKDQYMGRSEMWRLKNSLVNTCVYLNKKIEFCGGSNRCQVYEMWSQGDRVACGVINDDTKVVFRSSTSMVYLFIQMSSEMWDFDIHGDLYFEKAVNGFLSDLFQKWKRNGCNHEVTIVLFSRTFYTATSLEEFPIYMRECLQQDYKGRFYEDFYRVAVQNERYDDWSSTLVQLRRLFTDYQKIVLDYHRRPGENVPNAVNSTAAQGNFLEVLNMSLNVFEKHYLDRSFDRTGQLSVVITPGVGVFEVDRELTNVTKQRVIDNGVGSDLVCVGEQPLHAVPLLKFHNKDPLLSTVEDYSMPHWINLSFYSTNKKVAYSNFIPRIKLPPKKSKSSPTHDGSIIQTAKPRLLPEEECMPNSLFDYDAYDAQVFQLPPVHPTRFSRTLQRSNSRQKKTSITLTDPVQVGTTSSKVIKRKMSDPDIHHTVNHSTSPIGTSAPRSAAISIPHYQQGEVSPEQSVAVAHDVKSRVFAVQNDILETELSPPQRPVIGSAGSPSSPLHMQVNLLRPGRALINPFDPSHVTIKLTSNRRRWTHIFPKGPSGVLIQQHHYQAVPANASSEQHHVYEGSGGSTISTSPCNETTPPPYSNGTLARSASQTNFQDSSKNKGSSRPNALSPVPSVKGNKSLTLLWGATGEQEWTPALTTGVDWKSLTIPACLPITTDYFPDKRSLQNDYLVSDYNLLPDDVNADFAQQRAIYKKPLTTREVFRELVSQRLAQGFQLILLQKSSTNKQAQTPGSASNIAPSGVSSLVMSRPCHIEPTEEYFLSIGRIFHKITLSGSTITVTRYRPRHPYPPFNIHYRYRFQAPHHDTYEISWVSFTTEKLENFNWNYLDHYICTRGDTDFQLAEAQKYWRFRMYLLPLNQQATKKILSDDVEHCDIYLPFSAEEQNNLIGGFLKFLETFVNKIKRPVVSKKPRNPASFLSAAAQQTLISRRHSASTIMFSHNNSQASVIGNSPFRERLGSSNRIGDKFRPRSGSKVMERVKADSGTGGRVSPATEAALTDKSLTQHLSPQDADGFQHNSDFLDEIPKSDIRMLKKTANLSEILEAMSHPQSGVGFLAHHPSLPSFTFVSAEAVQWLAMHVEGIDRDETAVSILQERLICHASGDFSHPLIIGFYLYHCVHDEKETQKEDVEYFPPLGDVHSFENEWLEVEITHPIGWCQSTLNTAVPPGDLIPKFLNDPLPGPCEEDPESHRSSQVPLYKHTHLEIDIGSKSDRVEWGHARYQSIYKPTKAYELVVQWVTASGTIVSELIMFWARKAQSCGLQLIPIPADPLALPFTHKSDPLRGPIFIPLNIECLLEGRNFLFQDFPSKSWEARLFYFQESILEKFGFVSCTVEASPVIMTTVGGLTLAHHRQYVHLSGVTFILMPSYPCEHRSNSGVKTSIVSRQLSIHATRGYPVNSDILSSPHEEYITRHVSGKNKDDYGTENKVGFLWSWNHMLSKRWRSWTTAAAGDESFQIKFLKDFREFCANYDNRLKQFWDSSWEIKEKL